MGVGWKYGVMCLASRPAPHPQACALTACPAARHPTSGPAPRPRRRRERDAAPRVAAGAAGQRDGHAGGGGPRRRHGCASSAEKFAHHLAPLAHATPPRLPSHPLPPPLPVLKLPPQMRTSPRHWPCSACLRTTPSTCWPPTLTASSTAPPRWVWGAVPGWGVGEVMRACRWMQVLGCMY